MNPCLLVSVRTAGVRSRKRVFIAVGAVIPSNEKRRLISLKGNYAVTGIVLVSSTNRGYVTSAGNPIRENPSDKILTGLSPKNFSNFLYPIVVMLNLVLSLTQY